MTIVSHSHKFIFVCPRKVASTSVGIALSHSCSEDDVIIGDDAGLSSRNAVALPARTKHILPGRIREDVGAKIWDDYFKFTVVRNPWDLLVSYIYFKFGPRPVQHFHDVAAALADRGHEVLVLTANRGYENPAERYPSRERRDGVVIRRLPLSSFGKNSMVARVVGGLSFVTQAAVHGLLSRRPDVVLVSTAPPFCSAAALAVSWLRGVPFLFWVHDLNPDLTIALGLTREGSLAARLLNLLNRRVLSHAQRIVVLDRFMMERIQRRLDVASKTLILPPWPHVDADERIAHADNPWHRKHVGRGRRVVMFSGNHSPAHPLDTLLQAALQVQDDTALEFLFVGGGTGKRKVEATIERERPRNIRSLPYQPMATLRYSLAAADVQVVSVGDRSVGLSHPCKIYGALAVGRPILLFSPRPCHATDVIGTLDVGWRVTNGDVDGAVEALRDIQTTPTERLDEMGRTAQQLV